MEPTRRSLVVAMLTYRRPEDLAEAVPALVSAAEPARDAGTRVDLLVVDNDPGGGARDAVARLAAAAPAGMVHYLHEPSPGIAAARNSALDWAGSHDVLVFIDDDERPHPGWLEHLVDCHDRHGASAVAGAVVTPVPDDADPYIAAGRFFERLRHPTGTLVPAAATNNLLLDLDVVRRLGVRFDERLGLTGGSDGLFTREVIRRGGRIVWCDEAVVDDKVPPSRLTRGWVLRKAYRIGNTTSVVEAMVATSPVERAAGRGRNLGRGLARAAAGAARAAAGVATGNLAARARGQRLVARGLGLASGAVGIRYAEYARPGTGRRRRAGAA